MGQDFRRGVGQVAKGDINNFGLSLNLSQKPGFRGLVFAQRKELHELRAQCEELGDDPRDIWRLVHAQLGVTTISKVSSDQFPLARSTLQARLEQLQDEADERRLAGKISRIMTDKDCVDEVDNFCELNFGRTQLDHLKKMQLQKTLEFTLQYQPAKQPLAPRPQLKALPLFDFLIMNKKNAAAVFFLGFLIGGIWF